MTPDRYKAINALADLLVGSGPVPTALWNGLNDRERKVLNRMVYRCLNCGVWFDFACLRDDDAGGKRTCPRCSGMHSG